MAAKAQLTIRVTKSRSASNVTVRTIGSYASLQVNDVDVDLPGQPLYTTATSKAFWLAVIAAANTAIEALP
jgi:hypothetical protein